MLVPSIFGERNNSLVPFRGFEGIFPSDPFDLSPFFDGLADVDKTLYGKHAGKVMATDVRETDEGYEVDVNVPGFKKEDIALSLENGYLTVATQKSVNKDEEKKGKIIRQERYTGAMQRSFYVGEGLTEEDIKAKFEHGVLKLSIPKKEVQPAQTSHSIMIEG